MENFPEGWINRIEGRQHRFVNIVPQPGKEPNIKYFDKKEIYLPEERNQYENRVLQHGDNVVWIGITGWTSPPKYFAERYGTSTEPGIYDKIVTALIIESALILQKENVKIDLRHGASNVGVDGAALNSMDLISIDGSGVNCPKFMQWVDDDARGGPVYVAHDKLKYHQAFADFQKILLVTGGKYDAFYHDYLKRLKGDGFSIVADVIQVISEKAVPAYEQISEGEESQLINAAAFIRKKNSFSFSPIPKTYDELIATTQFVLLEDVYDILKKEPNKKLLAGLEDKILKAQELYQKKRPGIITLEELDDRINCAIQEYLSLLA